MRGSLTDTTHTQSRVELLARVTAWADAMPRERLTPSAVMRQWGVTRSTAMRWLRLLREKDRRE